MCPQEGPFKSGFQQGTFSVDHHRELRLMLNVEDEHGTRVNMIEVLPGPIGLKLRDGLVLDGDAVAFGKLHRKLLVFFQGYKERPRGELLSELAVLQLPCPEGK